MGFFTLMKCFQTREALGIQKALSLHPYTMDHNLHALLSPSKAVEPAQPATETFRRDFVLIYFQCKKNKEMYLGMTSIRLANFVNNWFLSNELENFAC